MSPRSYFTGPLTRFGLTVALIACVLDQASKIYLLFVFDLDALWQPLFLGVVLLVSVCLGSFRLIRIRNRLDLYG